MASPEDPTPGAFRCDLGAARAVLRWVEWGPPEGMPVVCVHGLTRNGRDFDALAQRLAALGRRVICPDVFGRGLSDWLPDGPLYAVPVYALAFRQLLEELPRPYDWVGTSMGGLIGMAVAGMPEFAPRRMVLNDVGPFLPAPALRRIASYLALRHDFADLDEVETHLRLVHAGFGNLPDAVWRRMAATSARRTPKGRLVLHYDPAIAGPMLGGEIADVDLWSVWDAISLPMLVLRGAESDLLDEATAARMAERADVTLATIPDCGHAPGLADDAQVARVVEFLSGANPAT